MSAPGGSDASVSVSSELAGRTVRIMYASSTELQALELVLQDPTTGASLSLAPGGHGGLAFELGIDVNTGMEGKVALVPSLTTNASLPASEMATLTMVDVAATEEAPGGVCVSSPLAVAEDSASVLEVDAGVSACKGQGDGTAPPASPPAEQSAPPPPPSPATANNDSGGDGSGGGGGEGLSAGRRHLRHSHRVHGGRRAAHCAGGVRALKAQPRSAPLGDLGIALTDTARQRLHQQLGRQQRVGSRRAAACQPPLPGGPRPVRRAHVTRPRARARPTQPRGTHRDAPRCTTRHYSTVVLV